VLLPLINTDDIIDIDLLVTFIDLINVDIVAGTMTTSIFIDMFWIDEILGGWDDNVTDSINELVLPDDLIWTPDVQIYNSIGGYYKQLDNYATFYSNDGGVWWSGRGNVCICVCVYM